MTDSILPPDPRGGLGFLDPDRFEHLQHLVDSDAADRQMADRRIGVSRQRRFPLQRMFRVRPAWPMRRDEGLGGLDEAMRAPFARAMTDHLAGVLHGLALSERTPAAGDLQAVFEHLGLDLP